MKMTGTVLLACRIVCRRSAIGQDHVRRLLQQMGCGGSCPICVAEAPLIIDLKIAANDPAELLETLLIRRGADLPLRIVLG